MYEVESDGWWFVPNPLNKFTVSARNNLKYNADGSVTLYFQNESPGKDKEANWLPAPTGGDSFPYVAHGGRTGQKTPHRLQSLMEHGSHPPYNQPRSPSLNKAGRQPGAVPFFSEATDSARIANFPNTECEIANSCAIRDKGPFRLGPELASGVIDAGQKSASWDLAGIRNMKRRWVPESTRSYVGTNLPTRGVLPTRAPVFALYICGDATCSLLLASVLSRDLFIAYSALVIVTVGSSLSAVTLAVRFIPAYGRRHENWGIRRYMQRVNGESGRLVVTVETVTIVGTVKDRELIDPKRTMTSGGPSGRAAALVAFCSLPQLIKSRKFLRLRSFIARTIPRSNRG